MPPLLHFFNIFFWGLYDVAKNISIYCPGVEKMAGNDSGSYAGNQEDNRSPGYCTPLRILACTLALCIVFVVGFAPARAVSAGATITVAGGTIGTGAMATGAGLASVALPVLGIVGVALLACGVDVALSNASAEAGMTKTEFIRAKLGEFAEARGQDVNHLINLMSNHLGVMSDGSIVVGQEAGEVIQQFGNWLYQTDSVVDGATSGDSTIEFAGGYFTINNCSYSAYSNSSYNVNIEKISNDIYSFILRINGKDYVVTLSAVKGTEYNNVYTIVNTDTTFNQIRTCSSDADVIGGKVYFGYNEFRYMLNNGDLYLYNTSYVTDIYNSIRNFLSNMDISILSGTGTGDIGEDVFTGAAQDWTDNKDLLIPGSGEATIVTGPDVINPAATAVASGDYNISVPDYLEALARAYNAGADAAMDIALTNTATGVATDVSITGVDGTTSAISQESSSAATAAATPVAAAGAALDAGDAVQLLKFPLTEIFPFCVVFDAYDMLSILRADPVVPQFTFSWPIPYMQDPITVNVDLSMFDTLATVVRYCELFLFVLGLALSTRDLIKG